MIPRAFQLVKQWLCLTVLPGPVPAPVPHPRSLLWLPPRRHPAGLGHQGPDAEEGGTAMLGLHFGLFSGLFWMSKDCDL